MSLNGSQTNPQKKKKYVKANKNNQSLGIKSQFDNNSISFDINISEIHPLSHPNSQQSPSVGSFFLNKSEISNKSSIQQCNLHHDQNFIDCKPEFEEKELLKSLKKYIKKAFTGARQIEIFYGKTVPILKFQYTDSKLDNQKMTRNLKELMTANKDLGQRQHEVITKIFDQLYNRISSAYIKIQKFLNILAEKKRIELDFSNFKKTPLLYYEYEEKRINFTFFDRHMRMFQFNSDVTQQVKLQEKELKSWSHFVGGLLQRKSKNQRHFDEFGQHQVSSGDQIASYEDTISMQEVQRKIDQLLSTDLASYQQQIEELDYKCKQLQSKNDDKERSLLQKLAEEQSELYHNLQNFKQVQSKVKMRLKERRDLTSTKNMLKQLIISQKQMHSRLPIVARKREIFTRLDKADLIILEGETGSGKSTQLPQMLCEYLGIFEADSSKKLPILITQPRRLATRTVAQRVASEMHQHIGGFVDYATSSYKPISKSAKIIFKLDSVVLDQLTTDRCLSKYSCLIIDEAHERTISIDVILGLVKQLQLVRKGFKVIVTSASLDAKLFEEYFKCKVMKVSGRLYPVEILYRPLAHQPDMVKKIEHLIKKEILLNNSQSKAEYKGDILVFCSGVDDINILSNIFDKYLNSKMFRVYALHGKIAVAEQREVFVQTKEQKVIFASRIAETSITINGVKVVIDPGVDRELVYDQRFRVSSRKLVNISQSSAKQRAGRAGRTSHGYCFRLYSEVQLAKFRVNKTPQIDNMALDTLVLRLKSLSVDNIFTFRYVKLPDKQALEKSVETLQMIGGLNQKQEITTIGRLLLQLHIQPFLGRSIVQAIVLDYIVRQTKYIDSEYSQSFSRWDRQDLTLLKSVKINVIQILCMVINSSNLFFSTNNTRQKLQEIKYTKFSSVKGDFFYLSNIYSQFYHLLKQDKNKLNNWLQNRYLNKKTLFQTKQLIEEITQIIKNFKFDAKDPAIVYLIDTIKLKLKYCKNCDDAILSCMITSFCVNLCLYSENPKVGYTLVLQKKPVLIYGTSTLALQGLFPKWIVCYDLKTNDKGITYCQIAHQVHFDFLKLTVQDYVFKRLNLRQAEKMNPFYQKIEKKLPTAILREIQNEYANNESNNHPILKYITYDISEQTNRIWIFYSTGLSGRDLNNSLVNQSGISIHDLINDYVEATTRKKKYQKLVYNIISNIFVQFDDGLQVKTLYFTDMEVQFLVKGERFILNEIRQLLEGINAYPFGNMLKIATFNKQDQKTVRNILSDYMLEFDDQKRQKKEQRMSAKIYMRFYTGKLKKQPLFMYYGKNEQRCNRMEELLQEFKQKFANDNKNNSKYVKIICESRFVSSHKKTGLKCYNTNIDSFQLKQALENLCINGLLTYEFVQPLGIQQFRTIQSSTLAARSQKQWQDQITKLLVKHKLTDLSVSVQNERPEQQGYQPQNIQKSIKQELTAIITSHSLQAIDEMVKLFDGKEGIIGAGKIHFRYNFKQLIVKINKRAFNALIQQFKYQKDVFESTTNVKIQTYTKQFGKVSHTFITCRSPVRQNLLKPTEKISNMFTPFIKRMEMAHFNFLCETDQGDRELERIEQIYQYSILIGFIKKSHSLKIYCLDDKYDQIQRRIDSIFQNHHLFIENVSYRGKGLAKVEQVLDNIRIQNEKALKKDKHSKLNINYNIIYKRREVQISGDLQSINKARREIQNICNIKLGSCDLCNKDVERPFKLINCPHQFCSKCLADYVDETKRDEDLQSNVHGCAKSADLVCPHEGCGVKINPNDVQALLSTEQFESLSYRRVKQFVKTHKQYFFCPTAKCEQIFQHKKIKEKPSFECVICGRWFCSSCKQPHQHFTCEEWSRKLEKNELLSFGYKKCQCSYIIQKEQKGKLIRCKSCNEYLCWTCNKSWRNIKLCQDHIRNCPY